MTRSRLAAGAVSVVLLVAVGVYIGRATRPAAPKLPPEPPPLPTGAAGQLPPNIQREVEFYARGSMIAVFFHEAAHMLISELKLPAVGPQEDVADEFATFVLTDALKAAPDDQKDLLAAMIWAGAASWKLSANRQDIKKFPFYDEHPPDLRRYYAIICLATGADPLRFIPLAVKDGVPQERLVKCADEYKTKHAAWDQLMAPHAPGLWRRMVGVHRLTLEFGPAVKTEWLAFENAYRQGDFFQETLAAIGQSIDLPEDIPVEVKGCGVVNAWWSPRDKKITLCHDLFQEQVQLFAENARAAAQQQAVAHAGGGPVPVPDGGPVPEPSGGTPQPAAGGGTRASLVGTWQCLDVMGTRQTAVLAAGGAYRAQAAWPNGQTLRAWGNWSAQGNIMRIDVAGTAPPAAIQTPQLIPFEMPQPNTLNQPTIGQTCQRVTR